MTYEPQVNDYVKWKTKGQEGWVYFKHDDYITIETRVWEKDQENYDHCRIHRNDRVLVLCYRGQWEELKYVRKRKSKHENEKSLESDCKVSWGESR